MAWSCTSLGGSGTQVKERLRQYVHEREQRLQSYPQIADFSGHTIQTRSDPLLRRIDAAFPARQFTFDCTADEGTAARESAFLHRHRDPISEFCIDSQTVDNCRFLFL
jgi:hypothetical protein